MQIAQQAATQMRKRQSTKGSWLAPPTPTSPVHPSTSAGTLSRSTPSPATESKFSLIQPGQNVITEDQARWFLTLPDKVRRQHFSREEQVSLMVRCKKVLEHASPELAADVYQRCLSLSSEDREPSFTKTRPSTAGGSRYDDGNSHVTFDTWLDISTDHVDWEMDVFGGYSRPDASTHTVAGTVDDMNLASIPPPPPEPKHVVFGAKPKRKSFIRRHSLTPLPLPAPTLAPSVPPVPPLPSPDQVRHFALSAKQSRPSTEQVLGLLEPPAERRYYQDQDARFKLRSALASTEKFDEALAFGFSPTDERSNSSSTDPSFPLQQPTLYHSEQEDDDIKSIETLSPRTPTYASEDQPAIKQPSFDSGFELPFTHMTRPKTSGSSNREMTIHMTLTRRDLRSPSPEEQLYSAQRFQNTGVDVAKGDPLALEPLAVTEDATGAHGAFAVHDGVLPKGLKRVWKSLTRH